MRPSPRLISVIMCAHNEEKYVGESVPALLRSLDGFNHAVLFVADRCTDKTMEKVQKYEPKLKIIQKNFNRWKNPYAENLQLGFKHSLRSEYLAIVDADVVVPQEFFKLTLAHLKANVVSVSPLVMTYPNSLWNNIIHVWEKTHGLGFHRGNYGQRIIKMNALKQIGGFRDVLAPDTDLDKRFFKVGFETILDKNIKVYHIRKPNLKRIINTQISRGRARRELGFSLMHTIAHAFTRFRLFVVCGWLLQYFGDG